MAQRVETRVATCAAQTTQASAVEQDLSFDPGTVVRVELTIPNGHMGGTGIAIAQAHQVIIPASGSDWIVGNDDRIAWDVDDFLNTGNWSAFVYNNGRYSHSWYVRFLINELTGATPTSLPNPISPDAIATA